MRLKRAARQLEIEGAHCAVDNLNIMDVIIKSTKVLHKQLQAWSYDALHMHLRDTSHNWSILAYLVDKLLHERPSSRHRLSCRCTHCTGYHRGIQQIKSIPSGTSIKMNTSYGKSDLLGMISSLACMGTLLWFFFLKATPIELYYPRGWRGTCLASCEH